MKISKPRKTKTSTKVVAVAGAALVVAGVVSALFKASTERKVKATQAIAREDEEAAARMDAEGGSMQPVAVS